MDNIKRMTDLNLDNNSISLAGEFAVLSQLALHGFDANMTLGRTKSVDILVSNPKSDKLSKLEVKTHYRNTPTRSILFGHAFEWIMLEKYETIIDSNLFYCFVNIGPLTHHFNFFIVPSKIVAQYVKEQHSYWLSTLEQKGESTKMRKFRIELDDNGYKIDTPLAKDFKDNWQLLK